MGNLAIIPARGGSKRIPRKNIKDFLGKPIIAYSIEAALQSNIFDEVMVSTDDKEIAEIALKYGATVPFYRDEKSSDDYATLTDVVTEVILEYQKTGKEFENVCCVLATAPLTSSSRLSEAYIKMKEEHFDAVFPVVKYSFPIQRALQFKNNKIEMIWPENLMARSQDLKDSFHDAGQFYWIKTKVFLEEKKLWTSNTGAVEIEETEGQDIDTVEDWQMAEIKYKLKNIR